MKTDAAFSADRRYRWWLTREWESGPTCAFFGVNPSTADERQDDPTIRRCIGFARSWGFGRLLMLNLYGYCATDPHDLVAAGKKFDIVGRENYFEDLVRRVQEFGAKRAIAAWGTGAWSERGRMFGDFARREAGLKLYCLMKSKAGDPMHPLYLPSGLLPEPWNFQR